LMCGRQFMDEGRLDELVERHRGRQGEVLSTLEAIQDEDGYLSREALEYVSRKTGVPLSRLYSLGTFYSAFSLKPRGRHLVTLCEGTTCHVRGAPRLLSSLLSLLRIAPESMAEGPATTEDREFTLETARCLGCCSLAPVIRVDGDVYGYNTIRKMPGILKRYGREE